MGKANIDPAELRRFSMDLTRFNNELQALIAQNPKKMGYEGVKIAVAAIRGQPVPPMLDTGVQLITKENLDTPEVKNLLGL